MEVKVVININIHQFEKAVTDLSEAGYIPVFETFRKVDDAFLMMMRRNEV